MTNLSNSLKKFSVFLMFLIFFRKKGPPPMFDNKLLNSFKS